MTPAAVEAGTSAAVPTAEVADFHPKVTSRPEGHVPARNPRGEETVTKTAGHTRDRQAADPSSRRHRTPQAALTGPTRPRPVGTTGARTRAHEGPNGRRRRHAVRMDAP